jgi:hypothetical protein
MAQYNPKRVLRHISNSLKRELFERQGHPLAVAWDRITDTQIDPVFRAIQKLPDQTRKQIEIVLQDVDDLANEEGIRVLVVEGRRRGLDLARSLEGMDSRWDKAMWVFLNHPDVWAPAAMFAAADRLAAGRSWAKRDDMPKVEPGMSQDDIRKLEGALSAYYRESQGRGHGKHVDHFSRCGGQDYYFVYLSDYADTHVNFDEKGEFHRSPDRRAFEIVFAYDRKAGTLEMYAKGGEKVVGALQQIFSREILGEDLPAMDPSKRPYRLDHLMRRRPGFATDPEDGIKRASIICMRLSVVGGSRERITIEANSDHRPDAIYDAMDRDLNQERLAQSILHVTKVTFEIRLTVDGQEEILTFDVYPKSCNLKSKREAHRLIGEKYLKRWKIDGA